MRLPLLCLTALVILAFLGCCSPDRRQKVPEVPQKPILGPEARQGQETVPGVEFTVDVVTQDELYAIVALAGIHEPAGWRHWRPDAIYILSSKQLLVCDRLHIDAPEAVVINYGPISVRWRERDLLALDRTTDAVTVCAVDEDELEFQDILDGYQVVKPPVDEDEAPVKFPAPRPIRKRPDDAERDLVARFGWQG